MTREDIDKYAAECAEANMITPIDCQFYDDDYNEYKEAYIKTFNQGVEYADSHPKSPWISVEEDLPCNHKELILYDSSTKKVLVIDHEGCIGVLKMKKSCNGIMGVEPWWQWEIPSVINYWMPIPELPKE